MKLSKPTLSASTIKAVSLGAGARRALKRFNEHVAAHNAAPLPVLVMSGQMRRAMERSSAKTRLHARKVAASRSRIKGGMAVVA